MSVNFFEIIRHKLLTETSIFRASYAVSVFYLTEAVAVVILTTIMRLYSIAATD